MRILLTMNLPCTRVHGGTNRSNRVLAEKLAERGHVVRVVGPALSTPSPITHEQLLEGLAAEGIRVDSRDGVDLLRLSGVEVHAVVEPSKLRAYLVSQINEFEPD